MAIPCSANFINDCPQFVNAPRGTAPEQRFFGFNTEFLVFQGSVRTDRLHDFLFDRIATC